MSALKKILMVDDEEDFCFFVKNHLERTGRFEVRTVSHGRAALKESRSFQPDLILLDIIMPDISGDEVAESLLEDPDTREIPFVFLSALASQLQERDDSPVKKIGGRHFIGKPISKGRLLEAIDSMLN